MRCCKWDGTTATCKHCRYRIRHDRMWRWLHDDGPRAELMSCDDPDADGERLRADPEGEPCCMACRDSTVRSFDPSISWQQRNGNG